MKHFNLPLSEEDVRGLQLGESVALTGRIYTGRDAAHKRMAEAPDSPGLPDIRGGVVYHCGPVIVRRDDQWVITAAGPTTSIREELYLPRVLKHFCLRAVIGKGGMGAATLEAFQQYGCVYLHAVGGAAQVLASCIRRVTNVYMLDEFGAPEAFWELEVEDFPAVVTMDAHGNSLHAQVKSESEKRLRQLLELG